MQDNKQASGIKISAVLLVRNEEANLRYCLGTLGWCDEIVVVDMESDDRTVEIAREYTDKIYSHPKVQAFDIAKGFAVDKASYDWIMLVDADEMIPKPLAINLRKLAETGAADIIEIPFRHYIIGDWVRNSGWGNLSAPRFFKKGKILFSETIHAYMRYDPGANINRLAASGDNYIVHFNYNDSAHFVEKLNRYTGTEAQHLFENGEKFSAFSLLRAALREFYWRFLRRKGYRDGTRGLSICLMMSFYRALTYIKLWEKYEFQSDPVSVRYERLRRSILEGWEK